MVAGAEGRCGLLHQPVRRQEGEAAPGPPDRVEDHRRIADEGDAGGRGGAPLVRDLGDAPQLARSAGSADQGSVGTWSQNRRKLPIGSVLNSRRVSLLGKKIPSNVVSSSLRKA